MAFGDFGQGEDAFEAEGAIVFTPIDEQGMPVYDDEATGGEPAYQDYGQEQYTDYGPPPQAYGPVQPYQMPPYGMQPPYGYPQMAPYGYPQPPYGYQDPYAMQPYGYGQQQYMDPYGYGMQPQYGYQDPYGQQQYMDPYAQQMQYQQCAMQFPPGTPQSVIDAACAMQQGMVQPWQVQDATTDLLNQGQTDAAAALLAKVRTQPGFHEGPPTTDELARGCKRLVSGGVTIGTLCGPQTAQTADQAKAQADRLAALKKMPGFHLGPPTEEEKKSACIAVSLGRGKDGQPAYATVCKGAPVPTDPAKCKTEMQKLLASAEYRTAQQVAKNKGQVTDAQRALLGRYVTLARCAGVTSTELQVAASKGKWTQRRLATRACGILLGAWVKRCGPKGCKGDPAQAVKNWKKNVEKARILPETPIADACAQKVIEAAQAVGKNIIAAGQTGQAQWNAYLTACQACKVPPIPA